MARGGAMILVSKAFHSYKTSTSGLLEIPEKTAAVANKWSGREDSNLYNSLSDLLTRS
jgi:hypothetical protein